MYIPYYIGMDYTGHTAFLCAFALIYPRNPRLKIKSHYSVNVTEAGWRNVSTISQSSVRGCHTTLRHSPFCS